MPLLEPWSWKPSFAGWFACLQQRASTWQPSPLLRLSNQTVRSVLLNAANDASEWLWTPCISALTAPEVGRPWQRDLQLFLWLASHHEFAVDFDSPESTSICVPSGFLQIAQGRHTIGDLLASSCVEPSLSVGEIQIDPWSISVGFVESHSWAAQQISEHDRDRFQNEMERLLRCLQFLKTHFPACSTWIETVAHVLIPTRGDPGVFRSSSYPNIPAVITLDLLAEHQIAEALVHESAHLYLYLAERFGALVDPAYLERHASPLRPEPRPLRGILLAFHALAFIGALYRDAADNAIVCSWARELDDARSRALEAKQILEKCHDHLTELGKEFFSHTSDVLAYSSR